MGTTGATNDLREASRRAIARRLRSAIIQPASTEDEQRLVAELLENAAEAPSYRARGMPNAQAWRIAIPVRAALISYAEADDELQKLTATVQPADLYNQLGFGLRNVDRDEEAGKWYRQTLYYDPDHKGA